MISIRTRVEAAPSPKPRISGPPEPLRGELGHYSQAEALRLFRAGLDNVDIAKRLECTPAAAANAIARARDAERRFK